MIFEGLRMCGVGAGIVADQNNRNSLSKLGGDSVEHVVQCVFCVVGDNKDGNFGASQRANPKWC